MSVFQIPKKLLPIYESKKLYNCMRGGRGGGKSEFMGGDLLLEACQERHLYLCTREIQKSISESVYKTLEKVAVRLGIYEHFEWQKTQIIHHGTGSRFIFYGLAGAQINSIKSIPNIDRIWIEEGQCVSQSSWDILKPTFIRNEGARCYITYNPQLETDPLHVLAESGDANVCSVTINLDDNPFATLAMREERDADYIRDPVKAQHIWGGSCVNLIEGAVYGEQVAKMEKDQRIGRFPYVQGHPVNVAFDIGGSSQTANHTSLVMWQWLSGERRFFRSLEMRGNEFSFYCDWLRSEGYPLDRIFLPHDAEHHAPQSSKSVADIVREAFPSVSVEVIERTSSVGLDINHVKEHFREVVIDKEGAASLLQAIRRYQWAKSRNGIELRPLHDAYSDTADAFRYAMIQTEPVSRRTGVSPMPATRYW